MSTNPKITEIEIVPDEAKASAGGFKIFNRVLDWITMMNFTVSAEANIATLEAMATKPDDTATLATITVPALITTGGDDTFIPKASAAALTSGIGNSRLHVIQDTGHVSSLEDPTTYNRVVDEFLATLPRHTL